MRCRLIMIASCLLFALGGVGMADSFPTITATAKAGPDAQVQGEYSSRGGPRKSGLQLVALGDGKFLLSWYRSGLPGDGWDGSDRRTGHAKLVDGKFHFEADKHTASWSAGKVVIGEGKDAIEYEKANRKSPTLEAKPPAGAVVLFDGKSADEWEQGRLVEANLLRMGVESKRKFQDFSLHLEFRTPYMPTARGQDRGNSGVYLQGRYEIQVLDSFGLAGEDNECGGIYKVAKPRVNMCYPPLVWQTYDIDFTAARFDPTGKKTADAVVTVKHNGVVIHDKQKLPGPTAGGKEESPEPGSIHLQDHGNPVYYRNIWVVEKRAGGS